MRNERTAKEEIIKQLEESGILLNNQIHIKYIDQLLYKFKTVAGDKIKHNAEDIASLLIPTDSDIEEIQQKMKEHNWRELEDKELIYKILEHFIKELKFAQISASVCETLEILGFLKKDKRNDN